tara:strand:+ start:5750 stop:6613 length:864 start_codon:yes stop_codon:yes gene_type:complete
MKIIKYFLQFLIIIILFIIFKIIGYKNASNFGSLIGRVFGKLIKSDKIIHKNLDIMNQFLNLHNNKDKFADEIFSNYGRILSDYVFLNKFKNGSLRKYINIDGFDYLEEIRKKNKQVIFISGHFNNFELMPMFINSAGIKLSAIYRPLNNIFLNKIMEHIRTNYICKNQIKKGKGGTRELVNLIKKNYSVALMIDQRVSEGLKCDLFGKPAYTTTIPAQIVKKYNCEIVPVYIERYDKIKFNLTISKPIKFDRNLSIDHITMELNKLLEKMIENNPSQWIFTHNRWK